MTARVPVLALAALLGVLPLSAQRLSYEGGLSASTGTYLFTERTNSVALSSGLRLERGRLSLRLGVPLWLQNTTLLTASGAGSLPTGGPEGQQTVRDSGQARHQRGQGGTTGTTDGTGGSGNGNGGTQGGNGQPGGQRLVASANVGMMADVTETAIPAPEEALTGYELSLGDPMVGLALRLIDAGPVRLTAGGTVKVPLASTGTVGSGHWDLGGSLAMSALLGRRWSMGVDVSRWHLGDLDSLDIRDPWLGAFSVGTVFGDHWGALLGVTASTTTLTGFDPPVTVSIALSRLTPAMTWGISFGAGLSETAPDFLVGLSWSVPVMGTRSP